MKGFIPSIALAMVSAFVCQLVWAQQEQTPQTPRSVQEQPAQQDAQPQPPSQPQEAAPQSKDAPQQSDAARQPDAQPRPDRARRDSASESDRPERPKQSEAARQNGERADDQKRRSEEGSDDRAYMGVRLAPTPGPGVLVTAVHPHGPAAEAGIEPGDFILSVNDQEVSTPDALSELVASMSEGDEVEVVRWRDGEEETLTMELVGRRQLGFRPEGPRQRDRQEQQAWMGVFLEPADEGVKVSQVFPEGPAARAGLRRGDIITRIGEMEITEPEEASEALADMSPGDTVEVTVMQDDEEKTVEVRLGDRGDFLGRQGWRAFGGRAFNRGQGFQDDDDSWDVDMGFPGHGMMMEEHRRLVEQNERIESLVSELRDEIQKLREELQGRSGEQRQRKPQPADRQSQNRSEKPQPQDASPQENPTDNDA